MKIGLITFYKDNYGSILQCYSTITFLKSLGYKCDLLCVPELEDDVRPSKYKRIQRLVYNCIKDPSFFYRWKRMHNKPFQLTPETKRQMDHFIETTLCPIAYSKNELQNLGDKYDAFIVGSDQVWNVNNRLPSYFFLDFAPNNKKIAFAVSLGVDKTNRRFIKTIREGIRGFNSISVREESGARILKSVSKVEIVRISDPTILLSRKEWTVFSCQNNHAEYEYALIHFLDHPSDLAVSFIRNRCVGKKIICIGYNYQVFSDNGWEYRVCGPKSFISYVLEASEIFTDSFHTSIFSINFGKQFYTFEREYLHSNPQTSRIRDLLTRYNLSDRFIKEISQNPTSIVLSKQSQIEAERQTAKNYLIDRLEEINERQKVFS